MGALTLGLIAALSWGVHDTCARFVTQKVGVFPSLFPVLATGCLMTVGLAVFFDGGMVSSHSALFAILSGLAIGVTGISFFKALSIGPVRLVAPVVASFPILSVGWAVLNGQSVSALQWVAVIVIVGGVGFVALMSDDDETAAPVGPALIWSGLAAVGFATSFALGQVAMTQGTELSAIATARFGAVAIVGVLALIQRAPVLPDRSKLPVLMFMGVLDATAIGAVMLAGTLAYPEFASVAASTFGVLTIILAAVFLKEGVAPRQWFGIVAVFAAIGYLALVRPL
ncbi:DMT family transporter [Falsiphaeobacter marinintestinus]|uniref:DMT family transporter n=1 Tax=Falsiphaeobacter marinintestinus TaxID=1492905 RepID=UPI0011B67EDF|nr:DMT family transporter [Phaeobacter marinintestinus]